MASIFAEKRQDNLNRFYTRVAVGELLVDQLGDLRPRNVLDLGVGEGTLSVAVVSRWPGIEAVTVDLDAGIVAGVHHELAKAGVGLHHHHEHDVLDSALPTHLAEHGLFDLAVCNPPFFRPDWSREYARILQHAELAAACPSTADATAEILFLAQNLCMVRDEGKIALIAPDGLFTGARAAAFRRSVLDSHKVNCVLQLPRHSFHDTEARCFVLVITKGGGPTKQVKLLRYDTEDGLSEPVFVSRNEAENRMDYDFHSHQNKCDKTIVTLGQLGAEVRRGSLNTVARKIARFPTFHTTDYRGIEAGIVTLESDFSAPDGQNLIVAEAGDILLARVDRKLHEKVALVAGGRAAVTDCIYRVRVPVDVRASVFDALRSPTGMASLLAATKGVSARLLGKADLLNLPLQF